MATSRMASVLTAVACGGAALALMGAIAPLQAQKTDVVVLINGNRITGEVKDLSHGKLDYSTDDMGRLSIEWTKVVRLSSPRPFEADTQVGAETLRLPDPGRPGRDPRDLRPRGQQVPVGEVVGWLRSTSGSGSGSTAASMWDSPTPRRMTTCSSARWRYQVPGAALRDLHSSSAPICRTSPTRTRSPRTT